MTTTLHLGVIDIPYVEYSKEEMSFVNKKGKTVKRRVKVSKTNLGGQTTGKVAQILENKYHVMEVFFESEPKAIIGMVHKAFEAQLESILSGTAPAGGGLQLNAGIGEIEDAFKQFISQADIEKLNIPGIPTMAALKGVNHRMLLKKGPRRPSFRDTGLYQASFKAWVTTDAFG